MAVRIDADRLRARLMELSEVGRTPEGGVSRFSYGAEHVAAVRRVARWMREAGTEPAVDSWGNLFGIVTGEVGTLPPIAAGSHLDTVPNGGIFDGALGVLAAVEAAVAFREAGIPPKHPLLLLGFAEEEGTSYGVGCLGSLGVLSRAPAPEALHDAAGRSAADALRVFDTGLPRRPVPMPMAAYLELHIEQGPVLAAAGMALGAVDAIVGIARTVLEFVGEANHAGTTPMEMRRDALWGAADLVSAVRALARDTGGRAVGTVGRLHVTPGATNVVPGRVEVSVELRSPDASLLDTLRGRVESEAQMCASRHGLDLQVRAWRSDAPVPLNRSIHDEILAAAGDLDWPIVTMSSWAGHDAKVLQAVVPAGMIFVPSMGGISHSPREQTSWEDVARGAQVLCRTIERLDRSQPL
ncbi:MAG TPA: Zn-dependent hydrolase [bacterium]|nr:Zn-dependent hydrolase [bacterium]